MGPENTPLEKEKHRPKPPILGFHVSSRGCTVCKSMLIGIDRLWEMFEVQHSRWQTDNYVWCVRDVSVVCRCFTIMWCINTAIPYKSPVSLGYRPSYFNNKGFMIAKDLGSLPCQDVTDELVLHMVLLDRTFWGKISSFFHVLLVQKMVLFIISCYLGLWVYATMLIVDNVLVFICTYTLILFCNVLIYRCTCQGHFALECWMYACIALVNNGLFLEQEAIVSHVTDVQVT